MSTSASPVKLANVQKEFRTAAGITKILDGISLEVAAGEMVGLLGASGSGKSTLLHLLGALDPLYSGSVQIQGKELKAIRDQERAAFRSQTIGFVFQSYHLMGHLSVLDNILLAAMFSKSVPSSTRALTLVEQVGLKGQEHQVAKYLSGGERQRVAIARALYHEPPILLCDEPTGNLDRDTSAHILKLLNELRSNESCMVVVTHDPWLAGQMDRTCKLAGGRLC